MKYLFLFLVFNPFFHVYAQNAATAKKIILEAVDLYNNREYNESLNKLDALKAVKDSYPIWYYYKAINYIELQQNQLASAYLDRYLKLTGYKNPSKAYYQIGKNLYNSGNYESALVNLELALDTSNSTKLDNLTELLIEKSLQKQNYFENLKKHTFDLFLGYGYDTNKINKSASAFSGNLAGHSANYGFIYTYKALDTFTTSLAPTVSVIDSYTLNSNFKTDSTTQSSDAFQVNLSLPLKITNEENLNYRYLFSLNGYWLYLPIDSASRELNLSVFSINSGFRHPVLSSSALQYDIIIASDTSHNLTNTDLDATGARYNLSSTFTTDFSFKENFSRTGIKLTYESNSPKGIDSKFDRYQAAVFYNFSSLLSTLSKIELSYQNTVYPTENIKQTDDIVSLNYDILKPLDQTQSLGITFGASQSNSTNLADQYKDFTLNLNYLKSFAF